MKSKENKVIRASYIIKSSEDSVSVNLDSHDSDSLLINTAIIYTVLQNLITEHGESFGIEGLTGTDALKFLTIKQLQGETMVLPKIDLTLDYQIAVNETYKEIGEDPDNFFEIEVNTSEFSNILFTFSVLLSGLLSTALKDLNVPIGDSELNEAMAALLDVEQGALPILTGHLSNEFHKIYHL